MAEAGRTVRVSGLPTDIEDDRLKDKLLIHFLRARNGGGEIDGVTIVRATPVCALITFEDSGVAQRVIQHDQHILEVGDKKYTVTATKHHDSLDPDKVILNLSATVKHSQLPGGITALTSLLKSHPDVQINYDATEELCTLNGGYSKVQAALSQLFGNPKCPQATGNKDSDQPATSGTRSGQIAPRSHNQESEHQSRKPSKQREQRDKVHTDRPSDKDSPNSHRDLTPGGYDWEHTGQTEGAALQLPGNPTMTEEDFSLIVDADMFQYLQKHCQKEYRHILNQYGVDVVDMTNQGLTTLFLQVTIGAREGARDQEYLKLARKAISRLYQENETKIRRDQFPKSILSLKGGQQRVMETLSVRFPKLLLNEDDLNIYIIGNSSDVSEAKQFLFLDASETRGKKEHGASLIKYPPYDSGSSTHANEQRVPPTLSSTVSSPEDMIDDGARKYKLAARFKDSGLAALGNRPTDLPALRGHSSPRQQTHPGPMLGHDVLTQTAGFPGGSTASAQMTGRDILFKGGDALPSTASLQSKTSSKAHFIDTQPKSLSTTHCSLSGNNHLPPAESGSTLKRASSFSGSPLQKAQVTSQKSEDNSEKPKVRVRGRSSSFSNQTGRDKQEIYTADITTSSVMWRHIKEAYRNHVDDLTSDMQVKERHSDGGDLTVTLRGLNSSKVTSCQLSLQRLVDSVCEDFAVHELPLSELGITDTADETLQACCAEVRNRFKKVTMQILKKSLFLLGPQALCSQIGASLGEVFSRDSVQIPKQQDFSGPSSSKWSPSTSLQMNEGQSTSYSKSQVMPESQINKADGAEASCERRTNQTSETEFMNGSMSQSFVRKDPVVKEKVKMTGTVEMDGQKAESSDSHLKTGNDYVGSTTIPTDTTLYKKERTVHSTQKDSLQQRHPTDIQVTPKESRSGPGSLGSICVCGESGILLTKTKCGATMCSTCLDTVHVHCRVCHETERTTWGIQGKMSYSKLHISVPGHKKDAAIKITYCIPDGIQGEDHPSPGEPFQGGVFEAFFPDCEKTRKLVPRLEKAFRQGFTFTVTGTGIGARVNWDCIPHKTTLHGGKSGNGYPDSTYLTRLSEVLTSIGIESPARP